MNFVDLLGTFVNEQVLGLAIILIGLGLMMTKCFGLNKKKVPLMFVAIAIPLSILYHIFLSPELHVVVRVLNGTYQGAFSIVFAMGFYDLGKSLWTSIKYRVRNDNPTSKKTDPDAIE